MISRRTLLSTSAAFLATPALARERYQMAPAGSRVTSLVVQKSRRRLFLMNRAGVVSYYQIQLGSNPVGHKRQQGDHKTPEGLYRITHKNPQSRFHLSLGISYPNADDRRHAARLGVNPGGDIFIHGRGPEPEGTLDWTAGCIAVEDTEMTAIYRAVRAGIPISITA